MYVKANNETIEIYPYSIGQLRKDNPKTSFPRNISDKTLAEYNVFAVSFLDVPEFDEQTQKCERDAFPTFSNGKWSLGWNISEKTQEEIKAENAQKAQSVRNQRNSKLANCDWTQLADSPLSAAEKTEWEQYRQALRDISAQAGFPTEILWPSEPVA